MSSNVQGAVAWLKARLGAERVSTREADRLVCARDCWPYATIAWREAKVDFLPDLVVWVLDEEEVQAVFEAARRFEVPVVAYGGGSGVCGGTVPVRGGIVCDMKRMNRVLELDATSGTVRVQAGLVGEVLENELNRKGLTTAHFPSSMYCSTVGGWLAARSAGQLSTRYGKIEDIALGVRAVLPNGRILQTPVRPRAATGPDWLPLLVGSEGTLGIITEAVLRVHRVPGSRRFRAFFFPGVHDGLEAIRELLQRGILPAAVRLYDELDTLMVGTGKGQKALGPGEEEAEQKSGWKKELLRKAQRVGLTHPRMASWMMRFLPNNCLLVLTFEGEPGVTRAEEEAAAAICAAQQGRDGGDAPARAWWEHRYDVSYGLSPLFEQGAFVDTLETATTWDRLGRLYEGVRKALSPEAIVMAHFSHAYPEGCSVYFTFAASRPEAESSRALYRRIWKTGLEACLRYGGTASHHHGIGVLKAPWMEKEMGASMQLYRTIKREVDPKNICNPGKLGLE